jgi:transposase
MRRHELTDEEWAIIAPLLPNKPRGVARVDDRRVINGILWRVRTGAPRRDVPERYGPRTTLYDRFVRRRAATKIPALVDAEGRPIHLALTAGQAGDAPAGRELLARLAPGGILLADKAYDTDAIRAETAERGGFANVPPRTIRKRTFAFSPWLYRQRNLVERFFNWIKQMRGLASRYDRRPDNFLAALKLAAVRIWINAL